MRRAWGIIEIAGIAYFDIVAVKLENGNADVVEQMRREHHRFRYVLDVDNMVKTVQGRPDWAGIKGPARSRAVSKDKSHWRIREDRDIGRRHIRRAA